MKDDREYNFLLNKIMKNTNIDFRQYRPQVLKRRIQHRLHLTRCATYWDYILLLNKNPQEYDRLIECLTIKVSEFLRDPKVFNLLGDIIIPDIISQKQARGAKMIRAWSCGTAYGQEAYSQWYTKSGRFEAKKVLQSWVEKEQKALKKGFDGLRLTGNTFWLEKKDWRGFAQYEEEINNVIGKYKMLALCSYSLDKCGASEVLVVIRNHQFALIKREGKWELIESSESKRVGVRHEKELVAIAAVVNDMLRGEK